jgi:hypothetical protein
MADAIDWPVPLAVDKPADAPVPLCILPTSSDVADAVDVPDDAPVAA